MNRFFLFFLEKLIYKGSIILIEYYLYMEPNGEVKDIPWCP